MSSETEDPNEPQARQRRTICSHCDRPTPTCICHCLPEERIHLRRSHCFVLQHPHEAKRKNRSLPFVRLCLDDASTTIFVGRHLNRIPSALAFVQQPGFVPWVLYPEDKDALSLSQALQQHRDDRPILLIALDASWKHAREMYRFNAPILEGCLRIRLAPSDWVQQLFIPRRFDIRAPPSPDHFSTAEALAWTLSQIEEDVSIYDAIVKPLDWMVGQWRTLEQERKARMRHASGEATAVDAATPSPEEEE